MYRQKKESALNILSYKTRNDRMGIFSDSLLRVCIVLTVVIRLVTATSLSDNNAFFLNVQVSDSLTNSNNCTDLDHWFLIEAEIYIPKGSSNDVYLTVPEDFDSLPNNTFSLEYNSNIIGSISNNGSNILAVSFVETAMGNVTTSFNFLAKLSETVKQNITEPTTVNYLFDVSTGPAFVSSLNFVAKSLSTISANGGIYAENSTAWFTADLPISLLSQSVYLTSEPLAFSAYNFDTNLTTYEIVLTVDAFNQPIKSVPFSALTDESDSSTIKVLFDTTIDGGKYVRINYFTQSFLEDSIGNVITLQYNDSDSSQLSKRDNALSVSFILYAGAENNIENAGDSITSITSSLSSTALYYNSSSTVAKETYETYSTQQRSDSGVVTEYGTWLAISTLDSSSLISSSSNTTLFSGSEQLSSKTVGTQSSDRSLLLASSTATYSSRPSSTFSNKNSTQTSSSNTPSSTISSTTLSQNLTGTIHSNVLNGYRTYSVISETISGKLTTYTSWYAISTNVAASNLSTSTESITNAAYPSSTAILSNTTFSNTSSSSPIMNDITTSDSNLYLTYSAITKTENGQVISYTSWYPVSKENGESAESSQSVLQSYETYSVVTKTTNGQQTSSTSWYPVSSVVSCESSPTITVSASSSYQTYTVITRTENGQTNLYTSLFADTPEETSSGYPSTTSPKPSLDLSETYSVVSATNNEVIASYTSDYPVSSSSYYTNATSREATFSTPIQSSVTTSLFLITSSVSSLRTQTISETNSSSLSAIFTYQASANRASFGIVELFVGCMLLFV